MQVFYIFIGILNVICRDCTGRSPLHFAAACGHVGILGALIQVGGTTNVVDNQGYTPLHWACFNGKCAIMQLAGTSIALYYLTIIQFHLMRNV